MDDDLEKIRQARLQQLQTQPGSQAGNGNNGTNNGGQEQNPDQESQQAEARAHILNQILEPAASDRLGRIRMVKKEKADDVENRLISMARAGQLKQRIGDAQLVQILESYNRQFSQQGAKTEEDEAGRLGGMKVQRKAGWDDDELDDLLDDA